MKGCMEEDADLDTVICKMCYALRNSDVGVVGGREVIHVNLYHKTHSDFRNI